MASTDVAEPDDDAPKGKRARTEEKEDSEEEREIAEAKMADLNANDMDAACRMLAGSARSMGITVTGE